MDPTTMAAATRRFPLLGRPKPACPALPRRVAEIAHIADTAGQYGPHPLALTEGAHALNKAALVASDCGLPDLAADLCWRHINVYRATAGPLTVLQARHMLEAVLNLARLQLRTGEGEQALLLLNTMFRAAVARTDLVVAGHELPLASLTGTRDERRKLLEWVWLQLLGDGIRALTMAGRWNEAVTHAQAHNGIGLHLMEGRQALIIAHCLNGAEESARTVLAETTADQPWERLVAGCLNVMCTGRNPTSTKRSVTEAVEAFFAHAPVPGYAAFRAQLGITVVTLARATDATDATAASAVLARTAAEAMESGDGYAAREVLRYPDTGAGLTDAQRNALSRQLRASGLGVGAMPEQLQRCLLDSAQRAANAIANAVTRAVAGEDAADRAAEENGGDHNS